VLFQNTLLRQGFFDNFLSKKKILDDSASPKQGGIAKVGARAPPPRAYGRKVGRLLLDVMKAAFSSALFLSGLEGGPTERILEAFCEAVVEEKAIVNRMSTCLSQDEHLVDLSVTDRLLLVTTMTMMLSTEMHNPAAQKNRIWTREKFAHVGVVDCGIQPSVMKKIYDRIREFPILNPDTGTGSPGT